MRDTPCVWSGKRPPIELLKQVVLKAKARVPFLICFSQEPKKCSSFIMDRLHITFWNQSCNLGKRRKFESVVRHKPHNLIQKNTEGSKFVCWDHVSWSVAICMAAALQKIVSNQYQSIRRLFEYHLGTVWYFFHTVFNAPPSEMASNHATWSKSNAGPVLYFKCYWLVWSATYNFASNEKH